MMSEGRKLRIVLPDDQYLDLIVQPKLFTSELLDMTASYLKLKETEYFGLSFKETTGHFQSLSLDRRVLDHDLPKNIQLIILFFQVRLYVDSIRSLKDVVTVELFYLNARQSIAQEQLRCDSKTIFQLAAYVLQEIKGDFTDVNKTRKDLQDLPLLPMATLKEHPSISFCEDQVIENYKQLIGMNRGLALVNYMKIVESLSSYGVHFYEVKDKSGLPWWLGLSVRGITIYDFKDRLTPRKEFLWKQLENIYYRNRKFSIQIRDEKSEEDGDCSGGSKHFFSRINSNVYCWFTSTHFSTKSVWSMAVAQHCNYIDLRTKTLQEDGLSGIRSWTDVSSDLINHTFLAQTSNVSRRNSERSLSTSSTAHSSLSSTNNSKTDLNDDDSNETQKSGTIDELYGALKERKEILENQLKKKTNLLLKLCIEESKLTGNVPPETPSSSTESVPKDDLCQLGINLESQDKIKPASFRLSNDDKSVRRSTSKRRVYSYQRASQKLKEMETKLLHQRLQKENRDGCLPQSQNDDISDECRDLKSRLNEWKERERKEGRGNEGEGRGGGGGEVGGRGGDERQADGSETNEESERTKQETTKSSISDDDDDTKMKSSSSVLTPMKKESSKEPIVDQISCHAVSTPPFISSREFVRDGYIPNSVYSTRTQYRSRTYPTLSTTFATQTKTNQVLRDNFYNTDLQTTEFYESGDELKTPVSPDDARFFADDTRTKKKANPFLETHANISNDENPSKNANPLSFSDGATKGGTSIYRNERAIVKNNDDDGSFLRSVKNVKLETTETSISSLIQIHRYRHLNDGGVSDERAKILNRHRCIETSKPFETSDFYKYSERLRRQRLVGNVTSSSASSSSVTSTFKSSLND